MSVRVVAVGRSELAPFPMPERFRHEITYFAVDHAPEGESLGPGEWWIDRAEAESTLTDGVVRLVSPLDSESRAEIEISEEQEAWLAWIVEQGVTRVRLE